MSAVVAGCCRCLCHKLVVCCSWNWCWSWRIYRVLLRNMLQFHWLYYVHITGHLLHPQAQSSLKITNCCFRYAAPHLWSKLPPSLRVPCQSATSECSPPSPGSDTAPKLACLTGSSILILKLNFTPYPLPRNLPLSLTDWFHGFYPARIRKSLALKILVSAAD